MDYYQTLGLDNNATPDEIEEAYKKLIKKLNSASAKENVFGDDNYNQVQNAYRILSSQEARKNYDNFSANSNLDWSNSEENFHQENPFNENLNEANEVYKHKQDFPSDPNEQANNTSLTVLSSEESQCENYPEHPDESRNFSAETKSHTLPRTFKNFLYLFIAVLGLGVLYFIYNQNFGENLNFVRDKSHSDITLIEHSLVKNDSTKISQNNDLSLSENELLGIATNICNCVPVSVSKLYKNNFFYLWEDKTKDEFDDKLVLENVVNDNGQWTKIASQKISTGQFDMLYNADQEKFKSKNFVNIKGEEFFYSIIGLGFLGTAYNGYEKYAFVFVSSNQDSKPITIFYERSADKSWGDFSSANGRLTLAGNPYVAEVKKFIYAKYGTDDYDINSMNNFNLKWEKVNSSVYDLSREGMSDIPLKITKYPGKKLFNKYLNEDELIISEQYSITAGFASPILAYDKYADVTLVLFIPEGWPNGCCWGLRSFNLKSFGGQKVVAADEENTVHIDILQKIISVVANSR